MADSSTEDRIVRLRDGTRVRIRPIRPDDAAAQAAMIGGLSAHSKHLLFLGGIAHLRDDELARMCAPDLSRAMAYVAIAAAGEEGPHIGLCRYASAGEPCEEAEISVAVTDAWQHRGVATLLLQRLIEHAREHGVQRLYSLDMATNHRMRRLARHLGFEERPDPDDVHQVIYSMALR